MLKYCILLSTLIVFLIIPLQNLHAQTQWQGEFGLGLSDQGFAMAEGPDGDIYVGGEFDHAGPYASSGLARWDGEHWHPVADFDGDVGALYIDGDILYAGGSFESVTPHGDSEITASNIVQKNLDTGSWSTLDGGLERGSVQTITVNTAGSVYAGGCFRESRLRSLDRIARWDGSEWRPLKAGTEDRNGVSACVYDMQYDHENGRLYLGGNFRTAVNYDAIEDENETIILGGVAYYDGRWRQIGGGISDTYPGLPNPRLNTIHLHENGNLYVGGTIWTAYNDPDRQDETDIRTMARWDGSQWHSVFDEGRGQVHVIKPQGNLLHLGGYFETAATEGQDAFTANSYAQYDVETGQLITDENGLSPFGEGFTDADGVIRRRGLIRDILLPENGDDVFVTGRFDRAEIEDELTDHREIDRIARWDGETWHAIGTGVTDEVTSLDAVGDTLFMAGQFHHFANRGEMHTSPYLAVYDRSTGLFVPTETRVNLHDVRGFFQVAADQESGIAYAALNTRQITRPDGQTEFGNILEWNPETEDWDLLGNLRQSQTQPHRIHDMEFIDGNLYIAGRFANLVGEDNIPNNGDLVRYNPDTGEFDWPDISGLIAADHREAHALAFDDQCVYALFWVSPDFREHTTGNIMCLDLETDQTHWYPGYISSSQAGSVDLLKQNEFLYVGHSASGWVRFFDDEGEVKSELDLSNTVSLLHPESESWLSWPGEYSTWIRGIAKYENALYLAGRHVNLDGVEFDGISLYDEGAAEWQIVGEAEGREHQRNGVVVIDDELWTWGDFRYTGNSGSAFLARYPEVSGGTAGPVAAFHIPDLTLALHQDQVTEVPVYVPNIGNEPLDWEISVSSGSETQKAVSSPADNPEWISASRASGTTAAGSVDSLMIMLDPSILVSGSYEASIEITGSDITSKTHEIPISLTVNPLHEATDPVPEEGAVNVSAMPELEWQNQRFPDSVAVYFGTSESFTEDDIIYAGEVISSISADSLADLAGGALAPFETYYWRVDQFNEAAEAEGDVWSFTTSPGEDKVVIGDQEDWVDYFPVYPSANPAWIQTLFPATDIGRSGTITSLAYYYTGEADAEIDVEIYIGTTDQEFFDDSDSWIPVSDMILAYDGALTMEASDGAYWLDLELDQAFTYNGNENLVIGVYSDDQLEPESALASIGFYATTQDENMSMFWYGEEEVNPDDAPGNGYSWWELPDIRLTFGEADDDDETSDPDAPILSSPEDGTDGLEPDEVLLGWIEPEQADSLQLQVSTDEGFGSASTENVYLSSESVSFILTDLEEQTTYSWRLRSFLDGDSGEWSVVWSFTTALFTSITSVGDIPHTIELDQNYPNPFNPDTQIRYGIPESSHVTLTVYNTLGQRVATVVNETQAAGWHEVRFDASALSSGMYIYQISSDGLNLTRTMMLVK